MDDLDIKLGDGSTLREAGGSLFMQWVLNKVNKANLSNSAAAQKLNGMANFYPGRIMAEDYKRHIIEEMKKAGIELQ